MKTFFKGLFEYNHHYNQQLAALFVKHAATVDEKSLRLFSHILNAHRIWNSRLQQQASEYGVWDEHPVAQLAAIDQSNFDTTISLIDSMDPASTVIYTNTRGQSFSNNMNDILFHAINHSTYHRGQIASAWRAAGLEPLSTDYIFYKR